MKTYVWMRAIGSDDVTYRKQESGVFTFEARPCVASVGSDIRPVLAFIGHTVKQAATVSTGVVFILGLPGRNDDKKYCEVHIQRCRF